MHEKILRDLRNLRGKNIQCEGSHADLADLADFTGIYQCINIPYPSNPSETSVFLCEINPIIHA